MKAILQAVFNQHSGKPEGFPIPSELLQPAIDASLRWPGVDLILNNIIRVHLSREEHFLLAQCARQPDGLSVEEIREVDGRIEVAEHLEQRGYLKKPGDTYQLRIGIMEEQLNRSL